MDITIVRHGKTTLNESGRFQGSRVDPSLSEAGIAYTKQVAEEFDNLNYDVIISSPLKRAFETAEILTGGNRAIITDARIKEIDFGEIDGKKPGNLGEKHPEVYDYRGLAKGNLADFIAGVETWAEVETRIDSFFKDIIRKYRDENILIVCHGGIVRAICAHLFGGTLLNFDQVDNVSFSKIHLDENADYYPRLIEYNRLLA